MRPARSTWSEALSRPSRHIELLSACFLDEAESFFSKVAPMELGSGELDETGWQNLRTMVLTDRLANPREPLPEIDKLLVNAMITASFVPKLETMEIWNASQGQACLFRYSTKGEHPQIAWRTTRDVNFELQPCLIILASERAQGNAQRPPAVVQERLLGEDGMAETYSFVPS